MALTHLSKHRMLGLLACSFLLGLQLFSSVPVLHAEEGDSELSNRARGAVAMNLQFMAADLLDELVYGWSKQAPLGTKSRVALMGVSVPIGLNAQLGTLLETRILELLIKNPQSGVVPVYCGACVALTSYSLRDKTIIARGAEIQEIAETLKIQAEYALYLDFEGHGSQLVLRAYIVSLVDHRIVYARSLATDSSQPPTLRKASELVSIDDARRDYLNVLEGRRRANLSLGLRTSLIQTEGLVGVPPFIWATFGFETFISQRKKWLADFQLGVASLRGEHNAWQLSSRVYRHLFISQADLVAPDVYLYAGPSYWEIDGPGSVIFKSSQKVTAGTVAARLANRDYKPKGHNTGFVLGMEARTAGFMRIGCFLESFLNQTDNQNLKKNISSYGLEFGVIL